MPKKVESSKETVIYPFVVLDPIKVITSCAIGTIISVILMEILKKKNYEE